MKIFVSWSGEPSKTIASALKVWLSDVFQDIDVWMSDHDVDAGTRWGAELNAQLEATSFGILCLTPGNLGAPWLLYEAGSLAKVVRNARVVPYRWHLKPTDLSGPLAQFQGVDADEKGTFRLVQSINSERENPLEDARLAKLFQKWWPDLRDLLDKVPTTQVPRAPQRDDRTLLEEILQIVRGLNAPAPPPQKEVPASMLWAPARPARTIHQVTEEEILAMDNDELVRYLAALKVRWNETWSSSEDLVLERKMQQVNDELRRRIATDAPPPGP